MNSHELAKQLLSMPAVPVVASIDISTGDHDFDRRLFGSCVGVNEIANDLGEVVILFESLGTND